MPGAGLLGGRYRLEDPPIGEGGMGVVYRAIDMGVRNRGVAVKTIRGAVDRDSVEQFRREWDALADLCHANIIDLYDVGEFSDRDGKKPFFVMPLLRGSNLADLLKPAGSRLDPERLVGIVSQACKGLQSAHNRGIVHRDLKPSNVFVLDDDCVKLIDFGVAHLVSNDSGTAIKGTLHYMAPEQLDGKATAQSDIFSLGVICYEALAGRKPFNGNTPPEVMDAIRSHIPPPLSDLNHSVPFSLAQIIHRALAKQTYHRISSARELSELLQRALNNDPLPQFDRARIAPRLARIKKALDEGDVQYAKELIRELQAEGHIDHEISLLRTQIEQATRARSVHQLLDAARLRMDEEDYPLALEKVQNVLELDPGNIDALALQREIGQKRSTAGIEKWYHIACQHRDNRLFAKAREAVAEILKLDPAHKAAAVLLAEIKGSEQEQTQLRIERQRLYESAVKSYGSGEISTALSKLERIIELGKRVSGHQQADGEYERLYNQIRIERDGLQASYTEARAALESKDLGKAREICQKVLDRRPRDPLFKALQIEVDEVERQLRSSAIAELHSRIESQTDLEAKFQLAKMAVSLFPDEQTFAQSLRLIKEKRDLINTIAGRAREYESQSQFAEARNQWDILRNIYPQYPGLDYELERLEQKRQASLDEQPRSSRLDDASRPLIERDRSATGGPLPEKGPLKSLPDDELTHFNPTVAIGGGKESPREDNASLPNDKGTQKVEYAGTGESWMWPLSRGSETTNASEPTHALDSEPASEWKSRRHKQPMDDERVIHAPAVKAALAAGAVIVALLATWMIRPHRPTQVSISQVSAPTNTASPTAASSAPPIVIPAPPNGKDAPANSPEVKKPATPALGRRPDLVRITLRTNPEPAEVKADRNNNLRCETPCSLNLSRGEHFLVLSAANREAVRRKITVPGDEDVFIELPQASGTVELLSNPLGLTISVDGREKGQTPIRLTLSTGKHHLSVTGNGVTREQIIDVSDQEEGLQIITLNFGNASAQ